MWVKRAEYLGLVQRAATAEAESQFLRTRLNELAREFAEYRFEKTGKPQSAPAYVKSAPRPADPNDTGISFDDMGDDEAARLGIIDAALPDLSALVSAE